LYKEGITEEEAAKNYQVSMLLSSYAIGPRGQP
jgi:hypothetical protein